jgi:hypothetical protein
MDASGMDIDALEVSFPLQIRPFGKGRLATTRLVTGRIYMN